MTDSIAEQCAKIAELQIISDDRLDGTTGDRRKVGEYHNTIVRQIAAAIRERMGEQK